VVAFVVAQPGAMLSAEVLNAHCLERIARFKRPREYHFVHELPKNNYGKVLKTALRERLAIAGTTEAVQTGGVLERAFGSARTPCTTDNSRMDHRLFPTNSQEGC